MSKLSKLKQKEKTDNGVHFDTKWLESVGFRPDPTWRKRRAYTQRIWSRDDDSNPATTQSNDVGMHLVVDVDTQVVWLETRDTAGDAVCLIRIGKKDQEQLRALMLLLGMDRKRCVLKATENGLDLCDLASGQRVAWVLGVEDGLPCRYPSVRQAAESLNYDVSRFQFEADGSMII